METFQRVSGQMCLLQNIGVFFVVCLFGGLFGFMIHHEHQRHVFHRTFPPYTCIVANSTFPMTIEVDHRWTVSKNCNCSDIFASVKDCTNMSFLGYFNPVTQQLDVHDPYENTLVPEMIIFGLLFLVIVTVLCIITCSQNKRIWRDHKARQRLLI